MFPHDNISQAFPLLSCPLAPDVYKPHYRQKSSPKLDLVSHLQSFHSCKSFPLLLCNLKLLNRFTSVCHSVVFIINKDSFISFKYSPQHFCTSRALRLQDLNTNYVHSELHLVHTWCQERVGRWHPPIRRSEERRVGKEC